MAINQSDALEQIQQILSGERWTVEDLESIAEVMRAAGYNIDEPVDEEEGESRCLTEGCTEDANNGEDETPMSHFDDAKETVRFAIFNELVTNAPRASHPYLEEIAQIAASAVEQASTAWAFVLVANTARANLPHPPSEEQTHQGGSSV